MKYLPYLVLLLFGVALLNGQAPAPPKPGPEMERIGFLLGEWSYVETYEADVIGPAGEARGTVTFRPGPGGFSLIADFHSDGLHGPTSGHSVFTWDPRERAYKVYTVGHSFGGAVVYTGDWQDADLVFRVEGGSARLRVTYTEIRDDSCTITLHVSRAEGPERLAMTSRAKKVK